MVEQQSEDAAEREPEPRPEPRPGPIPSLPVPSPRSAATWDRGGRRRRWFMVGCLAGAIVLFSLFYISFSVISRSMVGLADRACARVERRLPIELDAGQRKRLVDNLERVRGELARTGESNPLLGGFLGCVAPALEDDLLTVREVDTHNECIESQLRATAGPAKGGVEE